MDAIRVTTSVDLSGLATGMPRAASIVEQNVGRMVSSFQKAQAASKAASQAIIYDWSGSPLKTITRDFADLGDASENAGRRTRGEMTGARYAIRGLGEEIGVKMPRFVATWIASVGGVAPILSAAFAPIAVVGLLEVFGQIPEAIEKIRNKFAGWTDEAKKAYEESKRAAEEALKATLEHKRSMDALGTIGQGPAAAHRTEVANIEAQIARLETARRNVQKVQDEAAETIRRYEKPKQIGLKQHPGREPEAIYEAAPSIPVYEQAKADLDSSQKMLKQLAEDYQKAKEEQAKLQKEGPKVATEESVKLQEVRLQQLENEKKVQLARIALAKDAAEKMLAEQKATIEQETAALMTAEELRYKAEVEYAEKSNKLKAQIAAEEHRPAGPGIDLAELAAQHQENIVNIQAKLTEEQKKFSDEVAKGWYEFFLNYKKQSQESQTRDLEILGERIQKHLEADEVMTRSTEEHARRVYEIGKTRVEGDASAGLINTKQKIEALKALELQEYRVTMAIAAREYQEAKSRNDEKGMAEAQRSIQQIADQYNIAMAGLNAQLTVAVEAPWKKMFGEITRASSEMVNQVIEGHMKLNEVLNSSWRHAADNVVQNLMKMAEQRVIALAIEKEASSKSILIQAKEAAAKAWNAFSWSPAGVVLGALSAAATFAGIMALSSFDKGGIVPKDMIAQVHAGERVLTQDQTTRFERALNSVGGSGGSSGAQYHFHQAPGSSPHDVTVGTETFKRMMRDGRLPQIG